MGAVFDNSPEKFNVVSDEPGVGEGARSAILPFEVLFTGLMINQIYFWTMHQSIIQRVLGAVNLTGSPKRIALHRTPKNFGAAGHRVAGLDRFLLLRG